MTKARTAAEVAHDPHLTISDKLATLSLMGQEMETNYEGENAVRSILTFMKRADRRIGSLAMQSLCELFTTTLLPRGRELQTDSEYEVKIRELYSTFLRVTADRARDSIMHLKGHAIRVLGELAVFPEQQKEVLSLLVNKLGDSEKQAASRAYNMLCIVTKRRPILLTAIVDEIERLIFRPHIPMHAQFYGVVVLNALQLDKKRDSEVAQKMLRIYFLLFDDIFKRRDVQFKMQSIGEEKKSKKQKKKEEKLKIKKSARSNSNVKQKEKEMAPTHEQVLENKLLTAVISGVSKVYSIAKVTSAQFEKHLDSLYRAAHSNSLATSLRALMLLEKILYPQGPLPDRYYTSMYDLLYSQSIMSETNTHPALLGLIYKSCKIDSHTQRTASFVKRLLQQSLIQIPTFTIGALMVVAELLSENRALFHSLLTGKEDEGITVVKADNELSSMKKDKVKQLNKQSVQNVGQKSGKLIEIKEEKDEVKSEEEDDDNEDNLTEKQIKSNNSTNNSNITSLHSDKYDPSKRNPRYSGADATGLWEIRILASHYHPTVSHLANQILQAGLIESQKLEKIRKLSYEKDIRSGIAVKQEGNDVKLDIEKQKVDNKEIINMNDLDSINALDMLKVNYTSDPFEDFSLSAFLNRFAFKNPKKKKKEEEEQKNENKKDQKKLEKDSNKKKNEQIDSKIKIEKQDISDKESEDEEVNPFDNNNDDDLMNAKSFLPKHTNQQQPSINLQQIQQSNITLHSSEHRLNSIEFTKQSQSDVAPHEQFFFKYFAENPAMQRRKRIIEKKQEEKERKAKLKKKLEKDSKLKSRKERRSRFGDDEDDDEIEDDELDAYLQKLEDEAVGKAGSDDDDDEDDEDIMDYDNDEEMNEFDGDEQGDDNSVIESDSDTQKNKTLKGKKKDKQIIKDKQQDKDQNFIESDDQDLDEDEDSSQSSDDFNSDLSIEGDSSESNDENGIIEKEKKKEKENDELQIIKDNINNNKQKDKGNIKKLSFDMKQQSEEKVNKKQRKKMDKDDEFAMTKQKRKRNFADSDDDDDDDDDELQENDFDIDEENDEIENKQIFNEKTKDKEKHNKQKQKKNKRNKSQKNR